jgi:hypothetical protein
MIKFLYGCAAFTVIAAVFAIVSAISGGPATNPRYSAVTESIDQGAAILAADKYGAITLTANGNLRGFERSGKLVWERSFDRYDNPSGVAQGATAICADKCPSAMLKLPNGYVGVGGADPSGSVARALTASDLKLIATYGDRSVFADQPEQSSSVLQFMTGAGRVPIAPTVRKIPIPAVAYMSIPPGTDRAVIGSVGDDPPKAAVRLRSLQRVGVTWKQVGPSIAGIASTNACIAADGQHIGWVADRIYFAKFGESSSVPHGPPATSGNCTIDSEGITAVLVPVNQKIGVRLVRFTLDGRELWNHRLGGVDVLSGGDAVNVVVRVQAGYRVSVINARSGLVVYTTDQPDKPYAADDGSLVQAIRKGTPSWLPVPSGADELEQDPQTAPTTVP